MTSEETFELWWEIWGPEKPTERETAIARESWMASRMTDEGRERRYGYGSFEERHMSDLLTALCRHMLRRTNRADWQAVAGDAAIVAAGKKGRIETSLDGFMAYEEDLVKCDVMQSLFGPFKYPMRFVEEMYYRRVTPIVPEKASEIDH